MRKSKYAVFIVIICIIYGCKGTDAFQTEAKFIKQAEKTGHCGIFAFASVIEFEINTKYSDNKNTLVIVPCPELYGEGFFNTNDTYILKLERGNNTETNYLLIDDPKRSSLIKKDEEYWAIDIKHK